MTLQVQLVSPERVLWSGDAEMVTARIIEAGDIAFLTGHVPYLGALDSGRLVIRPEDGEDVVYAVHGGFVEVSDDQVSVLSDQAEDPGDIDVAKAESDLREAEAAEKENPNDPMAVFARKMAQTRIDVAGGTEQH